MQVGAQKAVVWLHSSLFQQGGHFFITMELLEGQPLQTVLRERGQLSPSNLLGIARQTCRGLDYAHAQGVIHRDIKTANLFVTSERVIKIMDFGLAKVLEEVRGATTLAGRIVLHYGADVQSALQSPGSDATVPSRLFPEPEALVGIDASVIATLRPEKL